MRVSTSSLKQNVSCEKVKLERELATLRSEFEASAEEAHGLSCDGQLLKKTIDKDTSGHARELSPMRLNLAQAEREAMRVIVVDALDQPLLVSGHDQEIADAAYESADQGSHADIELDLSSVWLSANEESDPSSVVCSASDVCEVHGDVQVCRNVELPV